MCRGSPAYASCRWSRCRCRLFCPCPGGDARACDVRCHESRTRPSDRWIRCGSSPYAVGPSPTESPCRSSACRWFLPAQTNQTPTLLLEEGDNLLQLRLLVQMTCSMSLYSLRMENLAAFRNRILQGTDPTHSYFFGAIVIVGL